MGYSSEQVPWKMMTKLVLSSPFNWWLWGYHLASCIAYWCGLREWFIIKIVNYRQFSMSTDCHNEMLALAGVTCTNAMLSRNLHRPVLSWKIMALTSFDESTHQYSLSSDALDLTLLQPWLGKWPLYVYKQYHCIQKFEIVVVNWSYYNGTTLYILNLVLVQPYFHQK